MSEETITGAEKEILRKQLEQLQKEYERTAKRLQRAERREAVRKHVQDTVSSQKRLLEVNASVKTEQSSSSSSDPLSKQSPCSENTKVRFDLPERADASPASASSWKQSPTQRLRSKRSRLRLRTRARESDTDESQEKTGNATAQWGSPDDGKQTAGVNLSREDDKKRGETRKDVRVSANADALEMPPTSQSATAHRVADSQSQVGSCHGSVQLPVTVLMQNSEQPARTTESEPDVFDSCTLVEGLPFPVEYYVRTTRRMASSRSPVNISAVVLAQLSKGWRRRKAGKTRDGSLVPSQPDGGPGRRRGARGCGKCQEESLRQAQTAVPPEPGPTPEPWSNRGPDFKHLPNSQLYLDCPLLEDSDVYPIFRKRRRQRSSDCTRPLPSLSSLTEALRDRDFQNLGRLLTILDIKDFHLPDEEFGLLKLERLCTPIPNVEPALRRSLRKRRNGDSSETWRIESERFTPCATSLENSFPLSQVTRTGHVKAETRDSDQSKEPVDRPDSKTVSRTPIEKDDEPEDRELTHKDETNTSQIGLMLNLSVSLATQIDPNPTFVSLGATPGCLAPPSSSGHASGQLSSPERLALCAAKESETPENGSTAKTKEGTEHKNENLINLRMQAEGRERIRDTSNNDKKQTSVTPEANNRVDSGNGLIGAEIESQGCNGGDHIYLESNSSEQGRQTKAGFQMRAVSEPVTEVHKVSVRPELELENCDVSAEGLKASQELARGARKDHEVSAEGLKASQEPSRGARKDHEVSAEGLKASQEPVRDARKDHEVSAEGLKASQEPARDARKDHEVSAEGLKASQEPVRDARKDHEVSAEGLKASQEPVRDARKDHEVSAEGLKASQEPERDARKDHEVSAEGLKASQEPARDARKDHEVTAEDLKASQEPARGTRKDHEVSAEGLKASQELARGARKDHEVSAEGLKASQEPERDARKDHEVSAEGLKASQELARGARKDHEVSAEGLKASQELARGARKDHEVSAEGLKASQEPERDARMDHEVSAEGLKASQELARGARKDHEVSAEGLKASQEPERDARKDHEVTAEGLKASQEPERDARMDHEVQVQGSDASDHVYAECKSFKQDQQTESSWQLEATGNKPETEEIVGPVNKVLVKPEAEIKTDFCAVTGSGCKTDDAESATGDRPKVVGTSGPTSGVHQEEVRDRSNSNHVCAESEAESRRQTGAIRSTAETEPSKRSNDGGNELDRVRQSRRNPAAGENGSQTNASSETKSGFGSQTNRQAVGDPLPSAYTDNDNGLAKDSRSISDTSRLPDASTNQRVASAETVPAAGMPDADVRSCGSLRKTHTFKALDSGGVLDVCVVRWPAQGLCVCVAGEHSVCAWTRKAGVCRWNPLHTWTFEQSLISLQDVPHSPGLLCVALGRMQIAEIRILCPGSLSQAVLCVEALQAVLAVPGCRVSCCSAPGPQQRVQVYTLSQDGRAASSLRLVSTNQSVRTLAVVERQSDALIGWTEQKTLLLWSMRSGQLLQTVGVAGGVALAACLKGYSYRGALCSLLQREGACKHESGSDLFALVAANPLTGKSVSLTSFAHPMPGAHRLIDSNVCESSLVGVFHSGRLVVWDLRGGVACVYVNDLAEGCRLARWAGPNTLLAGCLNGDVNMFQFTPAGSAAVCRE